MHLTFVLLPDAGPLDPQRIAAEYAGLFAGEALAVEVGKVLTLKAPGGDAAMATLIPVAISTGEVEAAAQHSATRFAGVIADTTHAAHVIVTTPTSSLSVTASLQQHSKIVAAIARAHDSHAIYDGQARATLPAKFFLDLVKFDQPLPLWTGISFAQEGADRCSFLTLGLARFDLPDLLVVVPQAKAAFAYELILDLAGHLVSVGKAIPNGDTIGRTAEEKFKVVYQPSPAGDRKDVMRIDVP